MHALQLGAVADVDAGRTDHDALLAGDTVAAAGRPALLDALAAVQRTPLLAALVVVGHDDVFSSSKVDCSRP